MYREGALRRPPAWGRISCSLTVLAGLLSRVHGPHSVPTLCLTEPHPAGRFVKLNLLRSDGKGQSRKERKKKKKMFLVAFGNINKTPGEGVYRLRN